MLLHSFNCYCRCFISGRENGSLVPPKFQIFLMLFNSAGSEVLSHLATRESTHIYLLRKVLKYWLSSFVLLVEIQTILTNIILCKVLGSIIYLKRPFFCQYIIIFMKHHIVFYKKFDFQSSLALLNKIANTRLILACVVIIQC